MPAPRIRIRNAHKKVESSATQIGARALDWVGLYGTERNGMVHKWSQPTGRMCRIWYENAIGWQEQCKLSCQQYKYKNRAAYVTFYSKYLNIHVSVILFLRCFHELRSSPMLMMIVDDTMRFTHTLNTQYSQWRIRLKYCLLLIFHNMLFKLCYKKTVFHFPFLFPSAVSFVSTTNSIGSLFRFHSSHFSGFYFRCFFSFWIFFSQWHFKLGRNTFFKQKAPR